MQVSLRYGSLKDFEKIYKFFKLLDKDFYPPLSKRGSIKERIKKMLFSKDSYYLLAENSKGNTIGIIGFIENYKGKKGHAYLSFLGVHPKYRHKGIGRFLREMALKILKVHGMKEVHTRTWSTNKIMIKINQEMGFKIEKIVKDERGPGVDSIYFKRKL